MASTAREQYLLELINDARLDPMGNAARYITSFSKLTSPDPEVESALDFFDVDGALFKKQLSGLDAVAPIAWNDKLAAAARNHSKAMIEADAQAHEGLGDGALGARVADQGYRISTLGENIFAFGKNPLETHAAFMVDWGGGTGGMQDPPGHRLNILAARFREVGVGIVLEKDGDTEVGPQVVTQDFATRLDGPAVFVLGAAFSDKDKDGFYSIGEGVKGLKVSLDGRSAGSAASGGYALGSDATGKQTITLSGGGLSGTVKVKADLDDGENLKLDLVDGKVLRTSASVAVSGPVSTIDGLGVSGLELAGGAGRQTLIGTKASDTLKGGSGADRFVFDEALGKKNVDAIDDFSVKGGDEFRLDRDVFSKLAKGELAEAAFFEGTKAHDKSDRIIHDADKGRLLYDADGKGGKGGVLFATLDKGLALDHDDFLVI